MVDLVFPLAGDVMRADYAWPLWQALRALLPWLADEPTAGILPIKGTMPSEDQLILGKRAQLTLRLPQERLAAAAALAGTRLDLGTELRAELRLGEPFRRELRPTSAQYSPMVALECRDETQFLLECARELDAMAVSGSVVCGRSQVLLAEEGELRGFSLMLHGLSAEHALRLQQIGIGGGRKLGCGIFVAHKTAVAVATN